MIFLVDDDKAYGRMVKAVLSYESRQVTVHTDPDTASAAIQEGCADLVLLDLHVGRRDSGRQVLAEIRAAAATRSVPVIVCSGDMALLELSLDEFTDRLAKPFDPEDLIAKVSMWLPAPSRALEA